MAPASASSAITSSISASATSRSASQTRSSDSVRSLWPSARSASSYASLRSRPTVERLRSLLLRLLRRLGRLGVGLALHRLSRLRRVGRLLDLRSRLLLVTHPELVVDLALELGRQLRVVAEELLGVVAALAEPGLAVGEERARLLDQVVLECYVEKAALLRDPDAVLDVELRLAERRCHLVLDDLDPDPVADRLRPLLEGLDPADVEALRGIELQRPPAGLGLWRAEHDANLLPDLVGEQADGVGSAQVPRQLAERLGHQPRLEAHVGVAHLALELDPRRQRRDRVDGDHVDGAGADQDVDDLQRLLAVVGLGNHQLVGVDPDPARVDGVES